MRMIIFCEGKDDKVVLGALCQHLGITNFDFEDYGGKNKLRPFLQAYVKSPAYTQQKYDRILITRDNDDNPTAAWQALRDAVLAVFRVELKYPGDAFPTSLRTEIAAFCIPNGKDSGMIETLCLDSLSSEKTPVLECVNQFIACVQKIQARPIHEKWRFTAWLVSQAEGPRFDLHDAIKKSHFNFDADCFKELRELLLSLKD